MQSIEKRQLGQSGMEVTVVTFGGWQAGKSGWTDVDDDESLKAMRAAYDSGINFFDTAEGYGDGHGETVMGEALQSVRDHVLIATKVGGHKADEVVEACDKNLKRLRTDHIDLYQIHWPSGSWGGDIVPIEETMGAMVKLKEAGKIRAIGVSNFSSAQIEEALQFGRIDSLQPPYSLLWREYEFNGALQTCMKHNIGVIAYSPLAQGLLTGKFSRDNRPQEGDNRNGNTLFKGEHYEQSRAAVEQLKPIAQKYGVTTGQLSLQWLLGQPGMTSVIVGARNVEQVQGNVACAGFKISDEDRAAIDAIGRTVTDKLPAGKTNMWA